MKAQTELFESKAVQNLTGMIRDDIEREFEKHGVSVICGVALTAATASVVSDRWQQETVDGLKPKIQKYITQKYKIEMKLR